MLAKADAGRKRCLPPSGRRQQDKEQRRTRRYCPLVADAPTAEVKVQTCPSLANTTIRRGGGGAAAEQNSP